MIKRKSCIESLLFSSKKSLPWHHYCDHNVVILSEHYTLTSPFKRVEINIFLSCWWSIFLFSVYMKLTLWWRLGICYLNMPDVGSCCLPSCFLKDSPYLLPNQCTVNYSYVGQQWHEASQMKARYVFPVESSSPFLFNVVKQNSACC